MGVKIDFLPEGLDDSHYPGDKLYSGDCLEVQQEGSFPWPSPLFVWLHTLHWAGITPQQ